MKYIYYNTINNYSNSFNFITNYTIYIRCANYSFILFFNFKTNWSLMFGIKLIITDETKNCSDAAYWRKVWPASRPSVSQELKMYVSLGILVIKHVSLYAAWRFTWILLLEFSGWCYWSRYRAHFVPVACPANSGPARAEHLLPGVLHRHAQVKIAAHITFATGYVPSSQFAQLAVEFSECSK